MIFDLLVAYGVYFGLVFSALGSWYVLLVRRSF